VEKQTNGKNTGQWLPLAWVITTNSYY